MTDRRAATTIGELDIHLSNLMDEVRSIKGKIDLLATKTWVDDELKRRDARLDTLAIAMTAASAGSKLKRAAEVAQQLSILAACVIGVVGVAAVVVRYWDKLP